MKDIRRWIPEESPLIFDGTWKGEFDFYGTLKQILIQPDNPDITYDIGIKDESGQFIYLKYNVRGIFVSDNLSTILFPGIKEIIISNANMDTEVKIKLIYQA
jgi:hypothetical protein